MESKAPPSIKKTAPLKHKSSKQSKKKEVFRQKWSKTAEGLPEEQQIKAVEKAIEVFETLPASSRYAQHRLAVLRKALELLNAGYVCKTHVKMHHQNSSVGLAKTRPAFSSILISDVICFVHPTDLRETANSNRN